MMAPEVGIDDMVFTEIVGDHEIPCDFAGDEGRANPCPDDPAEWVMYVVPCCRGVETRLACTHCKDVRLDGEGAVECGSCGHIVCPARHAYFNVEPLNKGNAR